VLIAHRDLVIEAEDHAIIFISNTDSAAEVLTLFSPEVKKSWF